VAGLRACLIPSERSESRDLHFLLVARLGLRGRVGPGHPLRRGDSAGPLSRPAAFGPRLRGRPVPPATVLSPCAQHAGSRAAFWTRWLPPPFAVDQRGPFSARDRDEPVPALTRLTPLSAYENRERSTLFDRKRGDRATPYLARCLRRDRASAHPHGAVRRERASAQAGSDGCWRPIGRPAESPRRSGCSRPPVHGTESTTRPRPAARERVSA
jgi:hypothetical protein